MMMPTPSRPSLIVFWLLWVMLQVVCDAKGNDEMMPHPTPFPLQFTIDFVTNLTATESSLPISGRLYYDWTTKRQRVDHGPGSYECWHFYNVTDQPCTLMFNRKGMYRVLHHQNNDNMNDNKPCCLDLPNIGPPPPNWAYNGTFNGLVYDHVSRNFAYQWTFDSNNTSDAADTEAEAAPPYDTMHHTVQELAFGTFKGRPLTFTFPGKAKGRQDYHFLPATMHIGAIDDSIYQLQQGCENLLCDEGTGIDCDYE